MKATVAKSGYRYEKSVKSDASDELINIYLLRPVAGLIVRLLYNTRVTPNQVTVASTVVGLMAAASYLQGEARMTAVAGLLVTLKDLLDSADGQLARAKEQYTRIGRFLDSIGDVAVDAAVFGAIGWMLSESSGDPWFFGLAGLGFFGITLRVSYHVFYQTSFLHLQDKYRINRVTEELTAEDLKADQFLRALQHAFQFIYGWQDRLMVRIDAWCRTGRGDEQFLIRWYSDAPGLRISGLLGMGTELLLLTICSVLNQLELYLFLNVFLMNGIFVLSLLYRGLLLNRKLQRGVLQ
jgi:archaetidylinositol phosphate synthase